MPRAFPRSQVSVKTVLTVCCTVFAVVLLIYILSRTVLSVGIVTAAALIAVELEHGVQLLQRFHWKRGWAILTVLALLVLVMVGIGWLVIPEAAAQIGQLVERLPETLEQLRETRLFRLLDQRFNLSERFGGKIQLPEGTLELSVTAARHVATGAVVVVTLGFLVIFLLIFGGSLVRALIAEATPANHERYERFVHEVYRSVGGYLAGLTVLALISATVHSIVLAILGLPYFLPLGMLSGLGSFIPFVGAITAGTLMGVVGYASGGVWLGVGVIAWYIVYQQIENHVFAPLVYKRTIKLNPLVALLAVIFSAELAGVVGAVFGVPVAAVAQIVWREIMRLRRERLSLPPDLPVAEALGETPPSHDSGPPDHHR